MFPAIRRTATRVRAGGVQRKHCTRRTLDYFHDETPHLVIDRERPGAGYTHVVRREEIRLFIQLLPDWPELPRRLPAIVLARGGVCMGWHRPGVAAICAWERTIAWDDCGPEFYEEHQEILCKIGVPVRIGIHSIGVDFTPKTAKAFHLVHALVHELGHHWDRMPTWRKRSAGRGESFAEAYARTCEDRILERYRHEFGL